MEEKKTCAVLRNTDIKDKYCGLSYEKLHTREHENEDLDTWKKKIILF